MAATSPPPPTSPLPSEPGILPHQDIVEMCGLAAGSDWSSGVKGPIRPCRRKRVRSASYDLQLGAEFYMRPERTPFSLMHPSTWSPIAGRHPAVRATQSLDAEQALMIPPNGVAIVTTEERVHFDNDIVGRLSLKMDLLVRGLIMASQGQMDAGYVGQVFALFYNLSDREISITRGDPILRLELIRLHAPSACPYDDRGDYQGKSLGEILAGPVGSSLQDMRAEVENTSERVRRTRWGGAILAVLAIVVLTVVLAVSGVSGSLNSLRERAAKLEGSENVLLNRLDSGADYYRVCLEVRRLQRKQRITPKLKCR